MKRVLLHVVFWIVYLSQDVLLIFLLNTSRLQLSHGKDLILAIENSCVLLLPKAAFTYFILYITLNKIVQPRIQKKAILYSLLALITSLLLYRALAIYFVDPVIYNWKVSATPFFYPLGFLVALMDIGFASGAAIAIKQVRVQLAAKEREKDLTREKLETELKYLRYQTHPHFLFNTLNNIYGLARKKSDQTPEVVMKLSKLLRFMLYETAKPSIRIEDEIKMLCDYIQLERLRYNERLTIKFIRDIDDENEQISPLLLLPFVENAFKHGVSESRCNAYIHIDLKLKNSLLRFCIENTQENNVKVEINENIGLRNVKRQLELMYKDYELLVKSENALFRVCLTINLKKDAKI